jgi:CRP-like cAMP-binding protein
VRDATQTLADYWAPIEEKHYRWAMKRDHGGPAPFGEPSEDALARFLGQFPPFRDVRDPDLKKRLREAITQSPVGLHAQQIATKEGGEGDGAIFVVYSGCVVTTKRERRHRRHNVIISELTRGGFFGHIDALLGMTRRFMTVGTPTQAYLLKLPANDLDALLDHAGFRNGLAQCLSEELLRMEAAREQPLA